MKFVVAVAVAASISILSRVLSVHLNNDVAAMLVLIVHSVIALMLILAEWGRSFSRARYILAAVLLVLVPVLLVPLLFFRVLAEELLAITTTAMLALAGPALCAAFWIVVQERNRKGRLLSGVFVVGFAVVFGLFSLMILLIPPLAPFI